LALGETARLIACPGCYPTAVLLALLPLAKGKLIKSDGMIIDAKSGVSGAGRTLKQNILFSDGSVQFIRTRLVDGDDIFTVSGVDSYTGREIPADARDIFLAP